MSPTFDCLSLCLQTGLGITLTKTPAKKKNLQTPQTSLRCLSRQREQTGQNGSHTPCVSSAQTETRSAIG